MAERTVIKINKAEMPFRRHLRKLVRNPMAVIGFVMFSVIALMCICAPLLTDCDPTYIDMKLRYAAPSAEHIFGCDQSGRDIFARLLYGGRISLLIGVVSAVGANILGIILGSISGYFGGWIDQLLLYICEILYCFPSTVLLLLVFGVVDQLDYKGTRVPLMILVFIVTGWASSASWLRAKMMSLKKEAYVESLLANGISKMSIMFRHILPNTLSIAIFTMVSSVSGYILTEAGLSFLGWGVEKGLPTWGNMINAARSDAVFKLHPRLWILPGLAILIFSLGINFFGDGLRDAFDVSED